jgi:hypothetical protein
MSSTDLEGTVKRDFGLFLKSDFDFGHFTVLQTVIIGGNENKFKTHTVQYVYVYRYVRRYPRRYIT